VNRDKAAAVVEKKLGFKIAEVDTPFYTHGVYVDGRYVGGTSSDRLVAAYNMCVDLTIKLHDKKHRKKG
jgi:hypothetical protein